MKEEYDLESLNLIRNPYVKKLKNTGLATNALLLGFFSGFPTHHFPVNIIERLKKELTVRDSLVFVSAWPSDYERNDMDATGMHTMFEECNMPFGRYCVIDNRTTADDAKRLIREASCIFLMGGHVVWQFQLICDKGILDEIRKSPAVILGVSAGSGNMAKRALDIWESHVPYVGIGLADITIKAHITQENQELLQTLSQISIEQNLPICAMEDESAIFVKKNEITYVGQIYWINKGDICPMSQKILERMLTEHI